MGAIDKININKYNEELEVVLMGVKEQLLLLLDNLEKQACQLQENISKDKMKSVARTKKRIKQNIEILEGCEAGWPIIYPNEWPILCQKISRLLTTFQELSRLVEQKSSKNNEETKLGNKRSTQLEKQAIKRMTCLMEALSQINITRSSLQELQEKEREIRHHISFLKRSWNVLPQSIKNTTHPMFERGRLLRRRIGQMQRGEVCPDCAIFIKSVKHSRGLGRRPFNQFEGRFCPKCGRSFPA